MTETEFRGPRLATDREFELQAAVRPLVERCNALEAAHPHVDLHDHALVVVPMGLLRQLRRVARATAEDEAA